MLGHTPNPAILSERVRAPQQVQATLKEGSVHAVNGGRDGLEQ
jgi:hypothetical protein